MKAIIIQEFGGPEKLLLSSLPMPEPGADEVLVQVKAISINPVDVKTRSGKGMAGRLRDQLPLVLGWDIAGIVTAAGTGVTAFKAGDAVFGMVNFPGHGRAYAEYVAAPAAHLALKPDNAIFEVAAATTLAALTAYEALTVQAHLLPGQTILVHAAAGGVGHFAVPLARHLGAHVIGTSSAANKDFVLGIGAHEHVDYKARPFEEVVQGVDFVLDSIGGENIDRSLRTLKPGGTLVSIPTGVTPEQVDKAKAAGINAFNFLVHSDHEHMKQVAALLEKGIFNPFLNRFGFEQMAEAHRLQESGRTRGKIVLTFS